LATELKSGLVLFYVINSFNIFIPVLKVVSGCDENQICLNDSFGIFNPEESKNGRPSWRLNNNVVLAKTVAETMEIVSLTQAVYSGYRVTKCYAWEVNADLSMQLEYNRAMQEVNEQQTSLQKHIENLCFLQNRPHYINVK